jgi:hypothetical protein
LHSVRRESLDDAEADRSSEELKRWAEAIVLSLIGFLVSAWFLSRTYTVLLYVLLSLAAGVFQIRRGAGGNVMSPSIVSWVPRTLLIECATLLAVYGSIRLGHLI